MQVDGHFVIRRRTFASTALAVLFFVVTDVLVGGMSDSTRSFVIGLVSMSTYLLVRSAMETSRMNAVMAQRKKGRK